MISEIIRLILCVIALAGLLAMLVVDWAWLPMATGVAVVLAAGMWCTR